MRFTFGNKMMREFPRFLAIALLLVSCSDFDNHPTDIHRKLIPVIASDILKTGESPLLRNQPRNFLPDLKPTDKVRWDQLPLSGVTGEGVITFYRTPSDQPLVSIGFDLHADQKSYIFKDLK